MAASAPTCRVFETASHNAEGEIQQHFESMGDDGYVGSYVACANRIEGGESWPLLSYELACCEFALCDANKCL